MPPQTAQSSGFDPSKPFSPVHPSGFDPTKPFEPVKTDEKQPSKTFGDQIGDFLKEAWNQVNPVAGAQGAAQAVQHPIDTVTGLLSRQGALAGEAEKAFKSGDYALGTRHLINYLLPVIGQTIDAAQAEGDKGNIGSELGTSVGLGGSLALGARGATSPVSSARTGAAAIGAKGEAMVADVLTPKTGPNKRNFLTMAEKAAPAVAREPGMSAMSAEALAPHISERLGEAGRSFEAAESSILQSRPIPVKPMIDAVTALRDELSAKGIKGTAVIPGPNQTAYGTLDAAIEELKKLGSVANYDNLRVFRRAWDDAAEAARIYSKSSGDLTVKQSGEAFGRAASKMRDYLAQIDPRMAGANAEYSLWKNADQAIQAVNDAAKVKAPSVTRRAVATAVGASVGASAEGPFGAATGAVIAPAIDAALAGKTSKIIVGRTLAQFSDALNSGRYDLAYQSLSILAKAANVAPSFNALFPQGQPAKDQK